MSVSGMHSGEKGEAADKLLEPGDMFGDYTVENLLGKGGMGAVYLVRAPGGERYAVKVMDADAAQKNRDFLKRFIREAEFAVKIRHPNLIPVHRVGTDEKTGLCYLVMDYLPGGSLADRLDKCKRLSIEESISVVVQIAAALEVAHRHGVVHRDIKPDNIMFDIDGTPKLADLGVAKFTDGAHRTTVTTTGMIIGTPAYMAPEQMMDSHHVDARADIYSLGVVLYEMLTGGRPHEESTAVELLAKAIKGEPLPDVRTVRPEISAALAYVLSLMCAPKPEGRPQTPHAVVELFRRVEDGTLEVPREILAPCAKRRKRRKLLPIAMLAVSLLLGGSALAWMLATGARMFASAGGHQAASVTNVTANVTIVTNLVYRENNASPDFSTLDPIRYAKMDDRTLLKELLTIDRNGTIREKVTRHGGIDSFCRAQGPLSVARRKALVNVFTLRDAFDLMGTPHEIMMDVLDKVRSAPNAVNMSIASLLARLPESHRLYEEMTSQKKDPAVIVQSLFVCLCPKPKSKAQPLPASSDGATASKIAESAVRPGVSGSGGVMSFAKAVVGIMEPVVGSSFTEDDSLFVYEDLRMAFMDMGCTVMSRSGMEQLLTDIGAATSSDLLNLSLSQKAKLGKFKDVEYLIVPILRKLGTKVTLLLKAVAASTGEEVQERMIRIRGNSLDEISDSLRNMIVATRIRVALLTPVFKMVDPPTYLVGSFNTWVRLALLGSGIYVASATHFQPEDLVATTDQDYAVLGRKLHVRYLIQMEIADFGIKVLRSSVSSAGGRLVRYKYNGSIVARMKMVDANDGSIIKEEVLVYDTAPGSSNDAPPENFRDIYGKQMVAELVEKLVVPRLVSIPGIR
jgi:serine/threonine protein kinase